MTHIGDFTMPVLTWIIETKGLIKVTSAHMPNFDERIVKYFEALERIYMGSTKTLRIILAADHGKSIYMLTLEVT